MLAPDWVQCCIWYSQVLINQLSHSLLTLSLLKGYLLSDAAQLIGIEKNQFFADLQQKCVIKFKMQDRVKVHLDTNY